MSFYKNLAILLAASSQYLFADIGIGNSNIAIYIFLLFTMSTLVITYYSYQGSKSAANFYAAGNKITAWQNGLAIAGDYISAATFLGVSGLVFMSGFDGLIYAIGFMVGWPIVLCLIAEPLKNLGQYTATDLLRARFKNKYLILAAAISSITIIMFYLIAQMVGSGKLIHLLFGIPYHYALCLIGCMIAIYVGAGGMLATTWVQIIKAMLLLFGSTIMAILIMSDFNFNILNLFESASNLHANGVAILTPGTILSDPISAISLSLALMFGTAGLPHILMRFFTVPNAQEAKKSILIGASIIGYFYILTFIIGFGAIIYLYGNTAYADASGALIGGNNMAAIHLSHALGSDYLMGFIAAIAFATILAVVAGLTLAAASAISHDIYAGIILDGKSNEKSELFISKVTSTCVAVIAILLGYVFEEANVAFMVGLAFAVAASSTFPMLFACIYIKDISGKAVMSGGLAGLFSALILITLSPVIWVEIFGFAQAIFPYNYPALFSMSTAFSVMFLMSKNYKASPKESTYFDKQSFLANTGYAI